MNCYQVYLLLKHYYPEAVPYHDSDHVITKIGDKFFDETGEVEQGRMAVLTDEEEAAMYKGLEYKKPKCKHLWCYRPINGTSRMQPVCINCGKKG